MVFTSQPSARRLSGLTLGKGRAGMSPDLGLVLLARL